MAKKTEKTPLKKGISTFMLIGEAKINDYTYKIDEKASESDWIYNVLNLAVDCGEYHGTIYADMMGGYGAERQNVIYVHGKDDNKDDYDNRFEIDWDDRFDEDILETIGDNCFITVGLERDKKGKVFSKKFLSAYDAIEYIKEHLNDGDIVNVKGNLKYSKYNDSIQVRKEITSIFLSKVESPDKYTATFTQTVLLDKDSIGKPDKNKGVIPVYGYVVDYVSKYKGKEIKQNVAFPKEFELEIIRKDREDVNRNAEQTEKFVKRFLKVKKGVNEVTFIGDLVEGGATITATEDDIPDDIKELIEMGAYTLEEALAKCSISGAREKRMILVKPHVKKVENKDGGVTPEIQETEGKYEEEDLIFVFPNEDDDDLDDVPFDVDDEDDSSDDTSSDDMSWLDELAK